MNRLTDFTGWPAAGGEIWINGHPLNEEEDYHVREIDPTVRSPRPKVVFVEDIFDGDVLHLALRTRGRVIREVWYFSDRWKLSYTL